MKSIVAENTKMIMAQRCLKQGAIAKRAGYDGKMFSNMMNGRKIITDQDVLKIAKALGTDANTLFGISGRETG